MKTEISKFCALCSQSLGTLPDALLETTTQFERGGNGLRGSLAVLNDLRARLRSLTEKLESQHAYLLIFGPLKSGKSTLMNAISGAYVSEVTSLPGYPCLVFVQNARKPRFAITRYNGRESTFGSGMELKAVVDEAHQTLADRICAAEERGAEFEPGTDYPEAIRRVDIKGAVPALRDSAMILVDTPGLYSRMKFGYDVLTREFRDGAACAVFVVKTDNLFLEQVFAEFNQLLGLFSRIFIVVNVDTSKRDLAPDGSLHPSAESKNPESVLDAFKTLSMAGPLRTAYEAGRVRIHAVDLLNAAARMLTPTDGRKARLPAFEEFQKDLTDYLNSSDYTRAFIRDSLRQARNLCGEMESAVSGDEVCAMRALQETVGAEIRALDAKIAATDRLLQADWAAAFQPLREDFRRATGEAVTARMAFLREEVRQGFTRWMAGKDSLAALPHLHWNPALTDSARALADESMALLERLAGNARGGLHLSAEHGADLTAAGMSMREIGRQALAAARTAEDLAAYKMTLQAETLPVEKTLADWLLFRSRAKVRLRLFGADNSREIPATEKERRLRPICRAEFDRQSEAAIRDRFPARPVAFAAKLADNYVATATEHVRAALAALRASLVSERDARQKPFDVRAMILRAADDLKVQAVTVARDIWLLAEEENDPFDSPPPIPLDRAAGGNGESPLLPALGMLPLLEP